VQTWRCASCKVVCAAAQQGSSVTDEQLRSSRDAERAEEAARQAEEAKAIAEAAAQRLRDENERLRLALAERAAVRKR
jgi:hypothetical protein